MVRTKRPLIWNLHGKHSPALLSTRFKFHCFFFLLHRFKNFVLHLSVKLPKHSFFFEFLLETPPAILTFPFTLKFIWIYFDSN